MATCTRCKAQDVGVDHIRQCWKDHYAAGGQAPAEGTFTNTEFGGEAPDRQLRHLLGITRDNRVEGKQAVKDAVGRWPRWNRDEFRWEILATDEEWGLIPDEWKEGPQELEDGIYLHEDVYYMVYHTQKGFQVCKKLELDCEEADFVENLWDEEGEYNHGDAALGEWVYVGASPLKHLRPEMKLDEETGQRFGQVYGWCCMCGRTLTNEESKKAGIGPICAGK